MFKKTAGGLLLLILMLPGVAAAHQPRITESRVTSVPDPEISKAYYGRLTGEADVYVISAAAPFELYVNVLVPDIEGQKKDVSAAVIRDGDADHPVAVLDGTNFKWTQFYEEFGADTYWMGPEYKARVDAGTYEIRVWSSNNDSTYSLAIGEIEAFDAKEGLNALTIIPTIKKEFFKKSPIDFIKSPFGWGLILVMYVFATIVGFAYRGVLKRFAKGSVHGYSRNIGWGDRLIRFGIAVALLLWAMLTTWSPLLIFFSGIALFEALASWCALYAALGRNTCPQ